MATSVVQASAILGVIPLEIYNYPQRLDILLQVLEELEGYFSSPEKKKNWLLRPNRALGEAPLQLIAKDRGQELLDVFHRLAFGVY
ncbi:MAG: antitoxin Xre/MbcA/ParS toxin-binding domain-containing protein [Patescibacteria group bacterium]